MLAPDKAPTASDLRLRGGWLVLARVAWLALIVLTLTTFFASLPIYLTLLQTPCAGTACLSLQLRPEQVEWLAGVGWSSTDYAAFLVALTLTSVVVCLLVSALIVWRRPDDRMALLVALVLVALGPAIEADSLRTWPFLWQVPNEALDFLMLALGMLFLALFPSGQFVPRWTRWPLAVILAGLVPYMFFPTSLFSRLPVWYLVLGEVALLLVAQLYRYRRMSGPLERQQAKWVMFGGLLNSVFWIGWGILNLLFPALADPTSPTGAPYQLVQNSVSVGLVLLIPLSIGLAILRYRLWDIDAIINKALVYGSLTALLGALYAGLIIGLESLAGVFTQQASDPVVLVISTLAIAALAGTARRRIQRLIDRRFYRKKYDAEKTLAAFSATLRNEVNLEQVREQLLAVVQETMQPSHVSLWLRQPEREKSRPV
jgi:hypothetical protein